MRKIFTKTALLAFCLFLSFSAKAQTTFDDGNYTYTILPEGYQTVSVKMSSSSLFEGAVAIPESVNHDSKTYTVTEIGENAFIGCLSMASSVTIPNSVTSIGIGAFYNCMYITSINIPDNVTSIGSSAFNSCMTLTSITIPDKVNLIGSDTFSGCSRLKSIKIGNGIKDLPSAMFSDCEALATIIIGNSVESISNDTFYGCYAIRTLYSQNTTAPDGVAFEQDVYDSATLYIPMGSRELYKATPGWDGFINIKETFTVGDITYELISAGEQTVSVKKYNNNTPYKGAVTIPSTVPFDGKDYTVIEIGDNAFESCTGLIQITIPDKVTSIGSGAFSGCKAIRTVYSSSVAAPIGAAFEQDVYDNATLNISIEAYASYKATAGWSEFKTVVAESTVGDITYRLTSADEQTVSVKRYNNTTFNGAVNIPSTLPFDGKDYTVTSIGELAFMDLRIFTSVTIPNSVTSIGNSAFGGCFGLTSITIPDNVTSIGKSAFMSCIDLKSAKIGNGVIEIQSDMFNGCAALAIVTVGNSVTSIGDNAFLGCKAIRTVYSRNMTAPIWAGVTFDQDVYDYATLLVRPRSKDSYNTTIGWKEFKTINEDITVGVDEVNSQAVNVFANGGYINVTGVEDNTPIAIYTLQGSLIYSGTCDSTPIEVSGAGLYIARIAGKSYKVVVQ